MKYQSQFHPELFKDKVVIVTGGGSGIGRCTAHELAALGAQVVVTGRKPEKLEKVVAEITEDGGKAKGLVCDIRVEEQVRETIAAVLKEFGRIDGLVNNAGGQFPAPMEMISANGFEAVVRNNLQGTFLMMREAYTQWMRDHSGAIVNLQERPQVGQHLRVGDLEVEVVEVIDLLPPRGDFYFLHATCRLLPQAKV